MAIPTNKINFLAQFRTIKAGNVAVIITLITCTYKAISTGNEWYLNIMKGVQEGKIDQKLFQAKIDNIEKQVSEQKVDNFSFRTEIRESMQRQNDKIEKFVTFNSNK